MDTEIYRELHEMIGNEKLLDNVLLREAAADRPRDVRSGAPEWSIIGQLEPNASGSRTEEPR